MKRRKLLFPLLLCLAMLTTPLYATLKVGTEYFYPPYVISTSEGFDMSLIQLLCQRMHEDCEIIPMDFHEIFPALDSGRVDLAIGGISISQDRLQKYIFSLPYLMGHGQFLMLKGSELKSPKDLTGKVVGVIKGEEDGSVTYQWLVQNYSTSIKIAEYNDMEDLISALSNKDIAAAFIHKPTAHYWLQNGGDQFDILGEPVLLGQGIAIMALPSKPDLIQKINQLLVTTEKDNSYLNLYRTYMVIE
ncbi:ABC transporter arginine-binding protein 1 precursor [Legionella massiliensis]|uniref:ABC transporter arginine-binding protein 1 n=1 Tax=Legionella massiliensis TaxID=1034943 RepID=A0A078KXT7_9GAMM|nr:transporter substrate-binding domain-containing protein [Legionella massiliensis]CDZ77832.1 ABC transporter arginine-binding protein 1 precursor [Legionella massiliensis]CEE13570.1 ABC transporter arginine-binding protein 1 precursor [Legionella massiliensis]